MRRTLGDELLYIERDGTAFVDVIPEVLATARSA